MAEPLSDAFVLFGATGDLAFKKIFPALHSMLKRGQKPFPIVGVSRGGSSLEVLRERARGSIQEFGGGMDEKAFEALAKNLRYVDGDYTKPELFQKIKQTINCVRIYPPRKRDRRAILDAAAPVVQAPPLRRQSVAAE